MLDAGGDRRAGDPALARGHRDHDVGAREVGRGGLPVLPGARPGADRARRRPGWSELRATLPEPPRERRARLQADVGLQRPRDARHRRRRRPRAGRADGRCRCVALPRRASGGSRSWPGAPTRTASTSPSSASRPPTSRGCRRWSTRARSTTSSPARCSTASWPARAHPTRSSRRAGSRWSPTRAQLGAAVDRAIEANPDVADKIRDGKVAAAGALIGAVMKEMRGQADAGRVRELILGQVVRSCRRSRAPARLTTQLMSPTGL